MVTDLVAVCCEPREAPEVADLLFDVEHVDRLRSRPVVEIQCPNWLGITDG